MRHLALILALWLAAPLPALADAAFVRVSAAGDAITLHGADPASGPDTPFAIASVGKTMTAVAVLRLVDRGLLELDAPVTAHLPAPLAAQLSGFGDIRLHHLLTMTSGLPDYYTQDWIEAALADPHQAQTVAAGLRAIKAEPALFQPGRGFDYSNTNYILLGAILEQATGLSYAQVMQAEVFGPARMTGAFVFGSRPLPPDFAATHPERDLLWRYYAGPGLGDGGVIASARDLVAFYRAVFVEGRLISAASRAAMLRDPQGQGYGMGIEVEGPIIGHSGGDLGHASDVRMDLAAGRIAVVLVGAEEGPTDWAWDHLDPP